MEPPRYAIYEIVKAEVEIFRQTKKPRCLICKSDFIKLDKYTWKPNCECVSDSLRLSMG
jgi:hypothetical protein